MKKKFAAILTAGLAAAALAGCQSNSAESTTAAQSQSAESSSETAGESSQAASEEASEEAPQDLSGSITLYTSQPEEDIQAMIDGFNEKWPDIQVDVFRSGTEEVVSKVLA